MKKDIEKYELIEKYLKKELPKDEFEKVSKQIKSDPDFAMEIKQHQALVSFVVDGSMLDLKARIKNIHENSKFIKPSKPFSNNKLLYTVAGIIVLTSLILIGTLRKKTPDIKQTINTFRADTAKEPGLDQIQQPISKVINKTKASENQLLELKAQVENPAEILKNQKRSSIDNIHELDNGTTILPNTLINTKAPNPEYSIKTISSDHSEPTDTITTSMDAINCKDVLISGKVTVENSCEHFATGQISLDKNNIDGGTPPYLISIDNQKNYYSFTQFEKLIPGLYSVWIKDKNNCFNNLGNYLINPVECNYEYIFAPDKGERWKIPNEGTQAKISIFNQNGLLVYEMDLSESEIYFWDGTSSSGYVVPMGIYSFILSVQTGTSTYGNITIVR